MNATEAGKVFHRKIYLASSWRNPNQPDVLEALRRQGHEVYDFRAASIDPGRLYPAGLFEWSDVDQDWESWTPREFIDGLDHERPQAGFASDFAAMEWADTFVLLMPCGKSAHLEAGWAIWQGKPTAIVLNESMP